LATLAPVAGDTYIYFVSGLRTSPAKLALTANHSQRRS
jgi:hypothetical protein